MDHDHRATRKDIHLGRLAERSARIAAEILARGGEKTEESAIEVFPARGSSGNDDTIETVRRMSGDQRQRKTAAHRLTGIEPRNGTAIERLKFRAEKIDRQSRERGLVHIRAQEESRIVILDPLLKYSNT